MEKFITKAALFFILTNPIFWVVALVGTAFSLVIIALLFVLAGVALTCMLSVATVYALYSWLVGVPLYQARPKVVVEDLGAGKEMKVGEVEIEVKTTTPAREVPALAAALLTAPPPAERESNLSLLTKEELLALAKKVGVKGASARWTTTTLIAKIEKASPSENLK